MAWAFINTPASVVESLTTSITLTEPAGVIDGDLLVACFAYRSSSPTAITGTGWTQVATQNSGNDIAALTTSVGNGTMLYLVRAGAPNLTFTVPTASVCIGRVVAYRGNLATGAVDVTGGATSPNNTQTVSVAGLTTTTANDILITMVASGRAVTSNSFNATSPTGASTAGSVNDPAELWRERADGLTTSGSDTALSVFDGIKTAAGATGNFTVTMSLAGGHAVLAGAFKAATWTSIADAWNINDKVHRTVVLSNNDKVAANMAVTAAYVRSTQAYASGTAGKYYAEVLNSGTGNLSSFGLSPTSALVTANSLMYMASTGVIWINAVNSGIDLGTPATGNVFCVAWDAGARLIWFRINGGNWNANASANPSTGTGGLDVSFAVSNPHALWVLLGSAVAKCDIRTHATDYTYTQPTGFLSWMGEVPAVGIPGVNVWSGSAWVAKPAKVWTGAAWVQKPVKTWSGTAWT